MTIEVRLVWAVDALLGEGPVWLASESELRFVDIKAGRLFRFHPQSGIKEVLEVGGLPSFVVPGADGGLLIGSKSQIHHAGDGGLGEIAATIDQPDHNRTNDATVDVAGRLWFGTMDDQELECTGAIWCLDKGRLHHMGGDAVVTNGPAVSADGRTLYYVDSGARRIWRCRVTDGPTIEAREVFVQLSEADGHPDGIVIDSEDCLWVALWDGWGVRRYAPDGKLLLHVPLPCSRVTKLAFGGPDLRTAYVTTARVGLDDAQLAGQPLAGGLFAFDAPVAGRALPSVRLG